MSYTLTDDTSLLNNTWLQGHLIRTSYDRLVSILGEPNGPTDDRTRACWLLVFDDGTFASIYDYRDGGPLAEVDWWSVGGRTKLALDHVQDIVPQETF